MRASDNHFTELMRCWLNPGVRDLAWAIGSPPLARLPGDSASWPDETWYSKQLQRCTAVLDRLDADASWPGEAFSRSKDQRLGAYFEFLVGQWLDRDERFELLASNLPVRKRLKRGGRETLGELDFIVRDAVTQRTEHWEVAVKFYLGDAPGSDPAHWIGPGRKDRLDVKLARLVEHQLRLPTLPEARAGLHQRAIKIDGSRVLIKGRLFYPAGNALEPPPAAAAGHLRGWWVRHGQFTRYFGASGWRWRRLTRGEWLAPVLAGEGGDDQLPEACEFAARKDISAASWPRMVVAMCDGIETSRGFIVPDGWGLPQ